MKDVELRRVSAAGGEEEPAFSPPLAWPSRSPSSEAIRDASSLPSMSLLFLYSCIRSEGAIVIHAQILPGPTKYLKSTILLIFIMFYFVTGHEDDKNIKELIIHWDDLMVYVAWVNDSLPVAKDGYTIGSTQLDNVVNSTLWKNEELPRDEIIYYNDGAFLMVLWYVFIIVQASMYNKLTFELRRGK